MKNTFLHGVILSDTFSLYFKHLLKINSLTDYFYYLELTLLLWNLLLKSQAKLLLTSSWLHLTSEWKFGLSKGKAGGVQGWAQQESYTPPAKLLFSLLEPLPWFISHRRKTGTKNSPFSPPEYSNAILEPYIGRKRQWLTSKAERCEGCGATGRLRNSRGAWGQQSYIPSEWSMNETELSGAHIPSATQI